MAKDEQGFDPDENYTKEDNPFWDATDAAHPAWWRAEEYVTKQIARQLSELVFGKENVTDDYRLFRDKLRTKLVMDANLHSLAKGLIDHSGGGGGE